MKKGILNAKIIFIPPFLSGIVAISYIVVGATIENSGYIDNYFDWLNGSLFNPITLVLFLGCIIVSFVSYLIFLPLLLRFFRTNIGSFISYILCGAVIGFLSALVLILISHGRTSDLLAYPLVACIPGMVCTGSSWLLQQNACKRTLATSDTTHLREN